MQWMVPHNRLGETQLHVLDTCLRAGSKHHWIQGFAGSGKTVLLVHAIVDALAKNPELTICVVVYTHALRDLVLTGIPQHLKKIPVMTYHSFLTDPLYFNLLIVDEVQDLEEEVLKVLVQHCDKLIIAGDEDQSIYVNRVSPGDIERIVSPTKHKLVELYRLTEAVRDIVRTILPDSLIHGARISRMANVQITLAQAENSAQEIAWCWQQASKYAKQGDPAVILLPKHALIRNFIDVLCDLEKVERPVYENNEHGRRDYQLVNEHLKKSALNLQYIGNKYGSLAESDHRPLVYLMTYHSAKGLDYETVFLPHLNEDTAFWSDDWMIDRRLFFVATTRSRRNLFMSYHTEKPHPYVQNMPQNLLHKIACEVRKETEEQVPFFF